MCRHTVLQLTLTYLAPSAVLSSMKSSPCMPVHACMLAAAQVPACVHRSTPGRETHGAPRPMAQGLEVSWSTVLRVWYGFKIVVSICMCCILSWNVFFNIINQNLCKAFHGKKDHQYDFENGLAFGRSAFSNFLHSDSDWWKNHLTRAADESQVTTC